MSKIKKIWTTLFAKNKFRKGTELDEHSMEGLFEELYELQMKMSRTQHYLEELEGKETLASQYEVLDKEDIHKLDILAGRAKTIEEKKMNLRGRLISNNSALARVGQYEEEIPDLIKEMQIAEKRRRETENHIFYLEEEKEELYEERESLLLGYRFLKGFSGIMIAAIVICLFVSFAVLQTLREQIWVVLTTIGFVVVALFIGVVILKENIDKELSRNVVLQQKAVKYLNKAKIRLFNQVQYLEFQYHKLGVDSVAKLELYYNRYLKNKNNERIYLQMNETLNEIEEDMLAILSGKGIKIDYINNLSDWVLTPKKLNEMKQVKEEREKAIEQIHGLRAYEEELWKEIYALGQEEHLKEKVAVAIEAYNESMMLDKTEKGA
ncbi:hypothetical protein [Cellulosilyticum lentocellum]|uniref:Uncharacterized protein n=1 Tax=Cellulosilyticum lentocellum (strain ATCC 49066 / DSM 5427 / NCIMB 11756 / RHM5) TaxID=642492 RepID=F2JP31_CELLD|nr:hypothetical protein [Cellulosilyticum lentocellum]ADZ83645.1 hypothetical protein Clole_1926 [Cellulosilyticum lentocellum DSM 5427]